MKMAVLAIPAYPVKGMRGAAAGERLNKHQKQKNC